MAMRMPESNCGEERVVRFGLASRLAHWSNAICFVLLLVTGAALVFPSFGHAVGPEGMRAFRQIHRVVAVPFAFLAPLIMILGDPKALGNWLKEIFSWSKTDLEFILAYPREFFGLKAKLPEQGKFNAGEKLNSLLTLFGCLMMAITGFIMLYPGRFSPAVVGWAHPLHSLGALVIGGVIIGHAYLSLLHPHSKESIKGMIWGTVSARFAREHHAKWYREAVKLRVQPAMRPIEGEEIDSIA